METKIEKEEHNVQDIIDVLVFTKSESIDYVRSKFLERISLQKSHKKSFNDLTPSELSAILQHIWMFDSGTVKDQERYLALYEGPKSSGSYKEIEKYCIPKDLKKMGNFSDVGLMCRLLFNRGYYENTLKEELLHKLIEPNFKFESK